MSNRRYWLFCTGLLLLGAFLSIASFWSDGLIKAWADANQASSVRQFASVLSATGDWPQLMLLASLALIIALFRRQKKACKLVICMMVSSSIAGGVVNSIRIVAGRARPYNLQAVQEWNGPWRDKHLLLFQNKYHSFPSGHAGAAFGFFGVLVFAKPRYGWSCLPVPFAIAWSRVYLSSHYFSDVTTGMVVGLLVSMFAWKYTSCWVDRRLSMLPVFQLAAPGQDSSRSCSRK
ncbi:MAG: phosphatase PAP2 family protein [Verrucomicrobia bacterium]|nr:phosphatase PAP2 family protein [Verrucomicrobiota bacterium]